MNNPQIITSHNQNHTAENLDNEKEIYQQMLTWLHKKIGSIPEEIMASHLLVVTKGTDFPVQNEATKEVTKRFGFLKRDKLKVINKPIKGKMLGRYTTGNNTSKVRPYDTIIKNFAKIDASCNCPDFLKNSLGVCKHVLCVYDAIYLELGKRSDKSISFLAQLESHANNENGLNREIDLNWHPIKTPTGSGDPLLNIKWDITNIKDKTLTKATWVARKWFKKTKDSNIVYIDEKHLNNKLKRKNLLLDLKALLKETKQVSDPALVKIVEAELKKVDLQLSFTSQSVLSHLKSLKKSLFPYQVESVTKFLDQKRLLIADDMGLGKTAQATALCHLLWRSKKVTKGLLIVPAALKSQWKREWGQFSDTPVEIVEGVGKERHEFYKRSKGFLIINYEQLVRDFPVINSWRPQLVVLDEAQKIKNWTTKNATYVKALTPDYRLVLTGTPFENRLDELSSILDWIDPNALEPKWRLTPWHTTYATQGKKEAIGARNLETIRTRLTDCFIRRRREEVIKQLPSRKDTIIPVDINDEQRDAHLELDLPIARLLARSKKRPLTQPEFLLLMSYLLRQRIISNGMLLANFQDIWDEIKGIKNPSDQMLLNYGTAKLVELKKLINDVVIQQGRKVIIFSQWRRMLKLAEWAITPILRSNGLRLSFFTGHESQKRRTQNIVELHDDPTMACLLLSDAGGVGLNLQRAADCCINLDLPWNPAVLEQRIGRIHRLGQKNPVDIYNIVSNNCIESKIAGVINNKKALFSGLFDGGSDSISFDCATNFMSQLERILEPVKISDDEKKIIDLPVEDVIEDEDLYINSENQADSFKEGSDNNLVGSDDVSDTLPNETLESASFENVSTEGNSHSSFNENLQTDSNQYNQQNLHSHKTKDLEIKRLEDGRINIVASERVSGLLSEVFQQLADSLRLG